MRELDVMEKVLSKQVSTALPIMTRKWCYPQKYIAPMTTT